jgi:hypothetical protein
MAGVITEQRAAVGMRFCHSAAHQDHLSTGGPFVTPAPNLLASPTLLNLFSIMCVKKERASAGRRGRGVQEEWVEAARKRAAGMRPLETNASAILLPSVLALANLHPERDFVGTCGKLVHFKWWKT